MFDYYRYVSNPWSDKAKHTDPREVYLFVYDDGRCRIHRRDRPRNDDPSGPLRIDRWYSSFDEVVPLLEAMTRYNRYQLAKEPVLRAPARTSAAQRRKHQAHMQDVAGVPMTMDLSRGEFRRIPKSVQKARALQEVAF